MTTKTRTYTLHSTEDYHVNRLKTLGWELTVCNALYPEGTRLRKMLRRDDSYGHLLYDYLSVCVPMGTLQSMIEIGGGYGYLTKDFLDRNGSLKPCMIDISPFLLGKQEETLSGQDVRFRREDFLKTDPAFLAGFDFAILNENLGDFPVVTGLSRDILRAADEHIDPAISAIRRAYERYGFREPEGEMFSVNTGAIEAVEKLCNAGIPYIFIGEHSCEAQVPGPIRPLVRVEPTGNPEKISLMGHDEYSIRFSHLEQIALTLGYGCLRGPFADYVAFDWTDELRRIMRSNGRHSDEDEMTCQFVEDLYKYEYLILTK